MLFILYLSKHLNQVTSDLESLCYWSRAGHRGVPLLEKIALLTSPGKRKRKGQPQVLKRTGFALWVTTLAKWVIYNLLFIFFLTILGVRSWFAACAAVCPDTAVFAAAGSGWFSSPFRGCSADNCLFSGAELGRDCPGQPPSISATAKGGNELHWLLISCEISPREICVWQNRTDLDLLSPGMVSLTAMCCVLG